MLDAMLIIVFGTRWHFKDVEDGFRGGLTCPDCHATTAMVEREAVKAFTLYWWPVIKLEKGGRLVECQECGNRFHLPDELVAGAAAGAPLVGGG
jgi:hypothetical protein